MEYHTRYDRIGNSTERQRLQGRPRPAHPAVRRTRRFATNGAAAPQDLLPSLGYPVEIITNDNAALQAATESFGHARLSRKTEPLQVRVGVSNEGGSQCPPEPTRREYNHLYSLVADVNNQALLDLRSGINFTWVTSAAVK